MLTKNISDLGPQIKGSKVVMVQIKFSILDDDYYLMTRSRYIRDFIRADLENVFVSTERASLWDLFERKKCMSRKYTVIRTHSNYDYWMIDGVDESPQEFFNHWFNGEISKDHLGSVRGLNYLSWDDFQDFISRCKRDKDDVQVL